MENKLTIQESIELTEKLLNVVNSKEEYEYLLAELQELQAEANKKRASLSRIGVAA